MACGKHGTTNHFAIIPAPAEQKIETTHFKLTTSTKFCFEGLGQNSNIAAYVTNKVRHLHVRPKIVGKPQKNCITLKINTDIPQPEEGYRIVVNDKGVTITAQTEQGLFYGFQTFMQMLPDDIFQTRYHSVSIPCCTIKDYPRYKWRAFRFDCKGKNLSSNELKRLIDVMATYKLNKLHLQVPALAEANNRLSLSELQLARDYAQERYINIIFETDSMGADDYAELNSTRNIAAEQLITTTPTTLTQDYRFDPSVDENEGGGLFELDSVNGKWEHKLLPALCAFSECLWTPREQRSWPDFRHRIEHHKIRLGGMGYSYSLGSFRPIVRWLRTENGGWKALVDTEVYGVAIHYTTDGTTPTPQSPILHGAVPVANGCELKILSVYRGKVRDSVYVFKR